MPGHVAGGDRRVSRAGRHRAARRSRETLGRLLGHPQCRAGHDHVHAERAHRGDPSSSRAATSISAVTRQRSRSGRRASGFRRGSRQLGLKDEHELQSWFIRQMDAFLTSQRAPPRRLGRDSRRWPRRERDRHVVAGDEGWHRRRQRRTRRGDDADEHTPTSITTSPGPVDRAAGDRRLSPAGNASTATSRSPPSWSRSSRSTCSARRGSCGPSTCRRLSRSSTWRSRD